jgi:hypothetical protein
MPSRLSGPGVLQFIPVSTFSIFVLSTFGYYGTAIRFDSGCIALASEALVEEGLVRSVPEEKELILLARVTEDEASSLTY